jgi:hypothetical protein
MLFVSVLYPQDNSFVGTWASKSDYADNEGNKHFHNLAIFINGDSTFKVMSTHRTMSVFNQITEASFIISEGSWILADSVLQMEVKYKLTNEVEIKYFKNFPRLALVGYTNDKTHLVEPIYRWQMKTQSTELYKSKAEIKPKEFFKEEEKELKL